MSEMRVNGHSVSYEIHGDQGARPWVITPGGRFSKDTAGLRELAVALAAHGNRVLIWDRPNCGASEVEFSGATESVMFADTLAGLLRELDYGPAIIAGGSGGSRMSILAAGLHPDIAAGLAVWWITGGTYGLLSLGMHYCGNNIKAVWNGGMEAVVALPEWEEVLARNPANRERILAQDPKEFLATMERWMVSYCPGGNELTPGLPNELASKLTIPALVFRSGTTDYNHTRATSEAVAAGLRGARLVEPPWGDNEWNERSAARAGGAGEGLFVRWPLLVPQLQDWADEVIGKA